jgi:tetratricopeptide (TPR) repeat protein
LKAQKFIPWLVIGVGLLVYCNSLRVGFLFDDAPHIVENARIRRLWPPGEVIAHTSRPVVMLSLALNYAGGGLAPWGYHLFNVGVHILTALTLYGVARLTFLSEVLRSRYGKAAPGLAGVMALLWLVHPLQTESVTYVIQRGELLMGLFYLLTLYCVIRSAVPSGSIWWPVGAVVSCALGMASKPVMVTAPMVVLLYDRAFLAKSWREVLQWRWRLYASLAATWLLLPLLLANGASEWKDSAGFAYGGLPALQYALTQPGVILHYLRLAFWPHPLCFDYGWNYGWPSAQTVEDALPELIVVGALLTATAWAWWRQPALGFVGLWFFLILAPTSSFVSVADLVVEHRMYLPLAAVVTVVSVGGFELERDLLSRRPQRQRILGGTVSAALVLLLSMLTMQRNRDYRSELVLWQDTIAKSPNNPRAYNGVGLALAQASRVQEAIGPYEQALRIRSDYAEAHNNLGNALFQLGRETEAAEHYKQALQIKPGFAEAYYNLGGTLARLGRMAEAIGCFEQAARLKPDYLEAQYALGNALLQTGRPNDAIEHFERVLQISPDSAEAHNSLGTALWQSGRMLEAIEHFQRALRLRPDYADARYNLRIALEKTGRIR